MNYLFKKYRTLILVILAQTASLHLSEDTSQLIDADEIAGYVNLHPALEQGLTILREHNTTIPTLATIFATHLKNKQEHEDECDFVDRFDAAIQTAQALIARTIHPLFMQTLSDAIENKNNTIDTNPVCIYVKNHHAGWMKFITEEWKHEEFELLISAITSNALPVVKTLLALDINKNSIHEKIYTPVHVAVQHNRVSIISMLFEQQFDCNTQNYAGQTPLLIAATHKRSKVMQILLQAGANPNIISDDKETALSESIDKNNIDGVKHLINANADLSIRHGLDYTALHIATLQNKPKIIHLLLQAGADVNAQCQHNNTALHLAIQYEDPKIIQLFLDAQADPTIKSRQDFTPLSLARNTGLVPMLTAAIEKKRKSDELPEDTNTKQARTALYI